MTAVIPDDPKGPFLNQDQVSDSSIGSGSSDQGIEPGHEMDDEFTHDITGLSEDESSGSHGSDSPLGNDDSEPPSSRPRPTHGLVEEGPGPDS